MKITDADREAAMHPDVSTGYTEATRVKVLRGEKDQDKLVQAFARHGEAAAAEERALIVAWLFQLRGWTASEITLRDWFLASLRRGDHRKDREDG